MSRKRELSVDLQYLQSGKKNIQWYKLQKYLKFLQWYGIL